MTKERFMEIFVDNIDVIFEISQKIKGLEDYRLVVLHMLSEIELEDRGLLK